MAFLDFYRDIFERDDHDINDYDTFKNKDFFVILNQILNQEKNLLTIVYLGLSADS